jgi:hypothetical protein
MAEVKRRLPPSKEKKRPVSVPEDKEELSLPTELSTPLTHFQDYNLWLYGQRKIGKTTLCSLFPDTFMMMAEPGAKDLSVYQRAITQWKQFTGYVKLLEKDKRFKTVVVDTVDLVFKSSYAHTMRRLGIDHPSEEDWGKGWAAIEDEFTPWMQRLLSLPKGVILVSHSEVRTIKRKGTGDYDMIQPTLAKQGRRFVDGAVDMWFYYDYDGKDRYLTIKGNDHITAGHRLQGNHFRHNGVELERVWMGRTPAEGFKNLMDAYASKYVPPRAEPAPAPRPVMKLKK